MNTLSARLGVHALETRLTPASLAPAALVAPQADLARVAPPAAAPAFNLNIAQLTYSPSHSTSRPVYGRVDVTNPAKVVGTFPVSFYWSDATGRRLELLGTKAVELNKTNPGGGHGFHFSRAELQAHPRPAWAVNLVAVVNIDQHPAESKTSDNVRVTPLA